MNETIEFFETQRKFSDAVFSEAYKYLLFGGATGGGKSYCVITIICALAKIFPNSRWCIVRKDLPTLRRNTIPTFEKIRPIPFFGKINQGTWTAKAENGSEILFFPESLKQDSDLDRWKGLEVNGFALEEANELSQHTFSKAIERSGRWTCDGNEQPKPLILLTCNPAKNYVKRFFYDKWKINALKPPWYYMPSYVTDNPHLTDEYLENLENLKETDERIYDRFVKGDWDVADEPDQLIKWKWVEQAKHVEFVPGKKRLGVDVARFGDDDTVFGHREGNAIKELEFFHGIPIDKTSDYVQIRINERSIDADQVLVDTVGLGAGVADNLIRDGYNIIEVVSGAKAIEREGSFYKFNNLRSQMWWEYREKLRKGEERIEVDNHQLFEDLTAPRYSVTGDKMLSIESKDDIKKRIGRSTNAGDATVYSSADITKHEIYFA